MHPLSLEVNGGFWRWWQEADVGGQVFKSRGKQFFYRSKLAFIFKGGADLETDRSQG